MEQIHGGSDDELPYDFNEQDESQRLLTFLGKLPTETAHMEQRDGDFYSWVFSTSSDNSVTNKMNSLLLKLRMSSSSVYSVGLLLQFWAVEMKDGRAFLTTVDQPFALSSLRPELCKLRLHYKDSRLRLDEMNEMSQGKPERERERYLQSLFSVFQECLPRCTDFEELEHAMFPIFQPSGAQPQRCVGVLDFGFFDFLTGWACEILKEFKKTILEDGNLTTYDLQEQLSYIAVDGLQQANKELEKALRMVCELHRINLAQTWIHHITSTRRTVAFKLAAYYDCFDCEPDEIDEFFNIYRSSCEMFPLQEGNGLVWKELPCYCSNTLEARETQKTLPLWSLFHIYQGFAIPLNSTRTGNRVYVLEFYWSDTRDKMILLEAIVRTLKRHLPSFKVVSGEELGEELRVLDIVESSMNIDPKLFTICKDMGEVLGKGKFDEHPTNINDNNPSKQTITNEMPKKRGKTTPIRLSREVIMNEIKAGRTMEDAAKKFGSIVLTFHKTIRYIY